MELPSRPNIIYSIIGIIIMGFIIYYIYYYIKGYYKIQKEEPWLIQGTKIARNLQIIPGQNLPFSNDSKYGIEFSYTLWIYITDWTYKYGELKHVFHRGNDTSYPLQGPGVWLGENTNTLIVKMNTFGKLYKECRVSNIPVGKWFHVAIILLGKSIEIYINGRLKRKCHLESVPRQNYGDLYINSWNGFDGFISRMRYYNYAIPYWKIEQTYNEGPSKAPCNDSSLPVPPYLAEDYWFNNQIKNE